MGAYQSCAMCDVHVGREERRTWPHQAGYTLILALSPNPVTLTLKIVLSAEEAGASPPSPPESPPPPSLPPKLSVGTSSSPSLFWFGWGWEKIKQQ